MLRELARACEDASWDDEIRVVVLTGAGRAFCVGADLSSWAEDYVDKPTEYWKWFGAFKDAHDRLREIGKPTVARINGIAVGGGNEFQMACDLAVMVDDAFIRHVGPEHGSVPPAARRSGCRSWSATAARPRDRLMCEEIPAAKAEEWGLVNRVVPAAELDAKVDELVENLARKLPQTTRYAKQHLNFWRDLAWHETINHARDWLALSMATDEPKAAIERFLEEEVSELWSSSATIRSRSSASTARSAERALGRADGAARRGARASSTGRRGSVHRPRRQREGVRGRGRHRRAGAVVADRPLLPAPHRALGRDPRRCGRRSSRGLGLLPRRRLRAGDGLRPDRRLGDGEVRPAGDRRRRDSGRGRHAAADAGGRQGARDGRDPQRPLPLRARGPGRGSRRAWSSPRRWLEEAKPVAREIASKAPIATRLAKEGVDRAYEGPLQLGLEYERRLLSPSRPRTPRKA